MSTMRIDRKIVGYRVEGSEEKAAAAASAQSQSPTQSQAPAAGTTTAATTGRDKVAVPQKAADRPAERAA